MCASVGVITVIDRLGTGTPYMRARSHSRTHALTHPKDARQGWTGDGVAGGK